DKPRPRKSNTDPPRSELSTCRGGFREDVFKTLKARPEVARHIARELLVAHFPASLHEPIADEVGVTLEATERSRARDPGFRSAVLAAWGHACAFCGFSVQLDNFDLGLEAAHIRWVQAGGPDAVANGLACCSLHHLAFDRGGISVNDDMTVLVSARLHGHGK